MEMVAKLSALTVSLSINHDKPLTALCVSHCVLPQEKKPQKHLRESWEKIEHVTEQVWQWEEEQRFVLILHTKQGIIRLIKFPRWGLKRMEFEIKKSTYVRVCAECVMRGGLHENPVLICLRTCTYSLASGVFFLPVISFEKSRRYYSWLCLYWGKTLAACH